MVIHQFFLVFWVYRSNSFYKMNTNQFLCLKNKLSPETCTLPVVAKELLRSYVVYTRASCSQTNVVTPLFISKFKFPYDNQPVGKVWLKINVQFYFGAMTLKKERILQSSQGLTGFYAYFWHFSVFYSYQSSWLNLTWSFQSAVFFGPSRINSIIP